MGVKFFGVRVSSKSKGLEIREFSTLEGQEGSGFCRRVEGGIGRGDPSGNVVRQEELTMRVTGYCEDFVFSFECSGDRPTIEFGVEEQMT